MPFSWKISGAQKLASVHSGNVSLVGKTWLTNCQSTRLVDLNSGKTRPHSAEVALAQYVSPILAMVGSGKSPGSTTLAYEVTGAVATGGAALIEVLVVEAGAQPAGRTGADSTAEAEVSGWKATTDEGKV